MISFVMWMVLSGKCDRASYAMAIWKGYVMQRMRRAQNKYGGSPVSDKGTLAVHVQEYRGGWTHISSLSSAYRSLHSPAESIRLSQLDCDVPSCDL